MSNKQKTEGKPSKIYCSNAEMTQELKEYKNTGVISEKLGQMFIDISTRYANKGKFFNYTEKEDWIGDIILRMVEQIDKFDPDHPRANAFAYFTMIAHRKILTNIKKFKRQFNTKMEITEKLIEEMEHNNKIQINQNIKDNIHYL
jgi:DNA-directed RNA polymerase specialized sigma24 family protein